MIKKAKGKVIVMAEKLGPRETITFEELLCKSKDQWAALVKKMMEE